MPVDFGAIVLSVAIIAIFGKICVANTMSGVEIRDTIDYSRRMNADYSRGM